ncbi:hypothetical protein BRPE64_BCDS12190 [Caballeronia insecticola]|uniref:Uncharacterized protein n=1 Tax=Caballeronia insecticola TaxID=758793 RepID=R4WXF9_9BURK|nr:hypothetical protein BRPE64_BCDS12190 [Caballeronia insecticola]
MFKASRCAALHDYERASDRTHRLHARCLARAAHSKQL